MPEYNAPLPGSKITHIVPGQSFTLVDGTENPAAGLKSAAFHRGRTPAGEAAGQLFTVAFPAAPTATVQIQGSYTDVDADYQVFATITTVLGYYPDLGQFSFYRSVLSAYTSGGMPIVSVV